MTKWNNGPPPSCGWWPASTAKNSDALRWWNGKYWSAAVTDKHEASFAGYMATKKTVMRGSIQWQHRPKSWPARSFT